MAVIVFVFVFVVCCWLLLVHETYIALG
jgi:hypothetical protein